MTNIVKSKRVMTRQFSEETATSEDDGEEEEFVVFGAPCPHDTPCLREIDTGDRAPDLDAVSPAAVDTPCPQEIDNGVRPPDPVKPIRMRGRTSTSSRDRITTVPKVTTRVHKAPLRLRRDLPLPPNSVHLTRSQRPTTGILAGNGEPKKKKKKKKRVTFADEVMDRDRKDKKSSEAAKTDEIDKEKGKVDEKKDSDSPIKYNLRSHDDHLECLKQKDLDDHVSPTKYKPRNHPTTVSPEPATGEEKRTDKTSSPKKADSGDHDDDHVSSTIYNLRAHPTAVSSEPAAGKEENAEKTNEKAVPVNSGDHDGPFKSPKSPTRKRRQPSSDSPNRKPRQKRHDVKIPRGIPADGVTANAKPCQKPKENAWNRRLNTHPAAHSTHFMAHRSDTTDRKNMLAPTVVHRPHQKEMRRIKKQLAMGMKPPPPQREEAKEREKEGAEEGEGISTTPTKQRRYHSPMPVLEPQCSTPPESRKMSYLEELKPPATPNKHTESSSEKRGRGRQRTVTNEEKPEAKEPLKKKRKMFKVPEISQERLKELYDEVSLNPNLTEEQRFEWLKGAINVEMNFMQLYHNERNYLPYYKIYKKACLDYTRDTWERATGKAFPPDHSTYKAPSYAFVTVPVECEPKPPLQKEEAIPPTNLNGIVDSEGNWMQQQYAAEGIQGEMNGGVPMDTGQPGEEECQGMEEGEDGADFALSSNDLLDVMTAPFGNDDATPSESNLSDVSEDSARSCLTGAMAECGMNKDDMENFLSQELGDDFPDHTTRVSSSSSLTNEEKPLERGITTNFFDDFFGSAGAFEEADRQIDGYIHQETQQPPLQRQPGKPTLRDYLFFPQSAPANTTPIFPSFDDIGQFEGSAQPYEAMVYQDRSIIDDTVAPLTGQAVKESIPVAEESPTAPVAAIDEITQTETVEEGKEEMSQSEAATAATWAFPAPEEIHATVSVAADVVPGDTTTPPVETPMEKQMPVADETASALPSPEEEAPPVQMTAPEKVMVKETESSVEKPSQEEMVEHEKTDALIKEAWQLIGDDFSRDANETEAYETMEFYHSQVLRMVEKMNKDLQKIDAEERKFFELAQAIRNGKK